MREKNRTAALFFIRLPALLLAAMLLMLGTAAGENALRGYSKGEGYVYLRLGQYPQTADGGIKPILWRVLTVDDEKAYLLSEYILFARALHTSRKEYEQFGGDFAQTELCHYLNTTFAEEAFTDEDMSMLLECEDYGKVFLITRDEMKDKKIGLSTTIEGSTNPKKIEANPGVRAPLQRSASTSSWQNTVPAAPGGAGRRPSPTRTRRSAPRTAARSAALK